VASSAALCRASLRVEGRQNSPGDLTAISLKTPRGDISTAIVLQHTRYHFNGHHLTLLPSLPAHQNRWPGWWVNSCATSTNCQPGSQAAWVFYARGQSSLTMKTSDRGVPSTAGPN
jgi:hypothetical protein